MKLTLYTEDFFDAAHYLTGYAGKCSAIHGHSWKVAVWIQGDEQARNDVGLLWDFRNLKPLIAELDHKSLNEVLDFNPTVENLALYIYRRLKSDYQALQFKVRVYESFIKKEAYCETGDF